MPPKTSKTSRQTDDPEGKKLVYSSLERQHMGVHLVKLSALENASGDHLFRPIREYQVRKLVSKYETELCFVTFIGCTDSTQPVNELLQSLHVGFRKLKVLGGELLDSANRHRVSIYRQLTVDQALAASAHDNDSVNDILEVNGFVLVNLCRTAGKRQKENHFDDIERPLATTGMTDAMFVAYPKLTVKNVGSGWKWYRFFAAYPEKYQPEIEAFSLALDEDQIARLPAKELGLGNGKMRVKFGFNAFRHLLEHRKIKQDPARWAEVFSELRACREANDYSVIKKSYDARRALKLTQKMVEGAELLVNAPATEQDQIDTTGASCLADAPTSFNADDQIVQNSANGDAVSDVPVPTVSSWPPMRHHSGATETAQVSGSEADADDDQSSEEAENLYLKRRRSSRLQSAKRSGKDVSRERSEPLEDSSPISEDELDSKNTNDAKKTQLRGEDDANKIGETAQATERVRASSGSETESDYSLLNIEFSTSAWLSSPEDAEFWRAKYYESMGTLVGDPKLSASTAEEDKASVERKEILRLQAQVRRLQHELRSHSRSRYWLEAENITDHLRSDDAQAPLTKSAVVKWYLARYEMECPESVTEALPARLNMLLDRMVVDGNLLYVRSLDAFRRGATDEDPIVMVDPYCPAGRADSGDGEEEEEEAESEEEGEMTDRSLLCVKDGASTPGLGLGLGTGPVIKRFHDSDALDEDESVVRSSVGMANSVKLLASADKVQHAKKQKTMVDPEKSTASPGSGSSSVSETTARTEPGGFTSTSAARTGPTIVTVAPAAKAVGTLCAYSTSTEEEDQEELEG